MLLLAKVKNKRDKV